MGAVLGGESTAAAAEAYRCRMDVLSIPGSVTGAATGARAASALSTPLCAPLLRASTGCAAAGENSKRVAALCKARSAECVRP